MNKRILFVMIAVLTAGVDRGIARSSATDAPASWSGVYVGRMPVIKQGALETSLRSFFGKSTGSFVPAVGPLLLDQFNAVGELDQYRLPNGRLIVNASNGRAGMNAVTVITDERTPSVLATAFLTHLCPQSGVDETFVASNGVRYEEHFRCELDYSLVILYATGHAPDADLNLDLTKWAQAYIEPIPQWAVPAYRKLMLRKFVRVLQDRPLDVGRADEILPLKISAVPPP